jgi:hypothetical protein
MELEQTEAAAFRLDVVTSVALSCLLTMDFVPASRPPPISEMVGHELPRVLETVARTQRLGGVEIELRRAVCDDPARLLDDVVRAIGDFPKARDAVIQQGHVDSVFSALRYTGKPPTATERRIEDMTRRVAAALRVDIPEMFDARIGDAYDATYRSITKV